MDQDQEIHPSQEAIISHQSWLQTLGYDFTPGVDNFHLNLSDDDDDRYQMMMMIDERWSPQ